MIPRLGINIDHVATLRQARDEDYPRVGEAAKVCLAEGADQITIHLREDRRHIQDTDLEVVSLVTKRFGKPLNLEMGCVSEIMDIAIAVAPDWVCFVPEKREELTTEGGLNLLDDDVYNKVSNACNLLKDKVDRIKISLFLEANSKILEKAIALGVDAVEIHTGDFARSFLRGEDVGEYVSSFIDAKELLVKSSVHIHAGHGLTDESAVYLAEKNIFEEFNIGHWVISKAIFRGLGTAVRDLKVSLAGACNESN